MASTGAGSYVILAIDLGTSGPKVGLVTTVTSVESGDDFLFFRVIIIHGDAACELHPSEAFGIGYSVSISRSTVVRSGGCAGITSV